MSDDAAPSRVTSHPTTSPSTRTPRQLRGLRSFSIPAWLISYLVHLAWLILPGCAGYQLGNANLFVPGIHTVHVPMFQSDTYRRNLSEWLTEAVVKEIESAGFKLVAEGEALHHPGDDGSKRVFENDIRGKTNQFMLKFQKPRR